MGGWVCPLVSFYTARSFITHLSINHVPFSTTTCPPTRPKYLLHYVNAVEQDGLLWIDGVAATPATSPPASAFTVPAATAAVAVAASAAPIATNSPPATPPSLPRQAAPAQCRQLAAAGIAALNDVYTLLPELVLDLGPDELATVALLVACRSQCLHLLPFHADGFGIWRLFWPAVSRGRLEALACLVLTAMIEAAVGEQEACTHSHTLQPAQSRVAGSGGLTGGTSPVPGAVHGNGIGHKH